MGITGTYKNLEQRITAEGRQYIVDTMCPKVLYVIYWGTVMAWNPLPESKADRRMMPVVDPLAELDC